MGETRKMRKGLWSPDEDEKLIHCIAMSMNGTWGDIARKAGLARCGKSCRRRWMNHLRPELKKGKFTPAEINQIVELQKALGNRWSKIAEHLMGRTDNDVKNIWNTQIKRRLIKQLHLQRALVEVKDDTSNASRDLDKLMGFEDNLPTNEIDVLEKSVSDVATNFSPTISSSSHSSHHHQEEKNINNPMLILKSPLSPQKLVHIDLMSKHNKLTSMLIFPCNSTSLFPSNPQQDIFKDELVMNDCNDRVVTANTFPTHSHLHFFDTQEDSLTSTNLRNFPHIIQRCTSMMQHIPHALSGLNLNKLSSSCGTTRIKDKGGPLDPYHMNDVPNVLKLPYLEVDTHVESNSKDLEKQESTQVMINSSTTQWPKDCIFPQIERHHGSLREVPAMEIPKHAWSYGSLPASKTLYEGVNFNNIDNSTSSCSSTIDSCHSSFSQSRSPCKSATTSMEPKEWHLLIHAKSDEKNIMSTLTSSMIDTYVGATKALEGSSASLEDNSNWWSTLEVPNFELPDLECW